MFTCIRNRKSHLLAVLLYSYFGKSILKGRVTSLKDLYPIDKEKVKHITEDVDNTIHLRYLCSCSYYLSNPSCTTVPSSPNASQRDISTCLSLLRQLCLHKSNSLLGNNIETFNFGLTGFVSANSKQKIPDTLKY